VVLIALLAAPQAFLMPLQAHAATSGFVSSAEGVKSPTLQEIEHGIADRIKRVEEFRFIAQEAAKLGVRAWLFGGTAAGYAHYVKWDMQREKGDERFQKDRFDYDYTNIYRSTQDLDIVIDGNAHQAQRLQAALQQKYPHLQGSKSAWEVRLLTQDMGDKLAILDNPDFLNQHTDSNSTGLIEVTQPQEGEPVVRDIKSWNSKEPYFLKDVRDGTIRYYFSPLHESTRFAKEGRNPPILSVIRYLTKAFQYNLKIRPEDLTQIKKFVNEFDPKQIEASSYVANWIENNAKKLVKNSSNLEYAWKMLDEIGLRNKLAAMKGNRNEFDSLAWWLSKEPLRSKPLGQGSGRTAQELGLSVVAHETANYSAFESMTHSHVGEPNVLISRKGAVGEDAMFGEGFYVAPGRVGRSSIQSSGMNVRFQLDPSAREGSDFTYVKDHSDGEQLVITNKAALKVIPESVAFEPLEYFKMLENSKPMIQDGDQALWQQLRNRVSRKFHALGKDDQSAILQIVKKSFSGANPNEAVIREWLSLPISNEYPELIEQLLKQKRPEFDRWIAKYYLSQPHSTQNPKWFEALLKRGTVDEALVSDALTQPHWKSHPEWVLALIKKDSVNQPVIGHILTKPFWSDHPEFVTAMMEKEKYDEQIARYILTLPQWKDHPELVSTLMSKAGKLQMTSAFTVKRKGRYLVDVAIALEVFKQPHWAEHPELLQQAIEKGTMDVMLDMDVLLLPHWKNHPKLRELVGGQDPTVESLRKAFQSGLTLKSGTQAPRAKCVQSILSRIFK
jgi:hypothetical protein